MSTKFSSNPRQRGFSIIDGMIAALVLAVGLLALAALQARVASNAADSRSRAQITAFVERLVERQRTYGVSGNFASVPLANLWTTAEVTNVANNAGVSSLNVSMTSTHFDGRTGTFVPYVSTGLLNSDPQYKVLHSVATWVDITGQNRRIDLTSILSPRITGSSSSPYNTSTGGAGSTAARPTIRTSSQVVEGMIPIAFDTGADSTETAATNPKPEVSTGFKRTSFSVSTYQNIDGSDLVEQQRKVDNAIINCTCSFNAAPTAVQFATPQWPAFWDGYQYAIYKPSPAANAPGVGKTTGPKVGVTQDKLCTECCRDHHDVANTTNIKFDPFRTDAHNHYNRVSNSLTLATSGDYLESCRMIRVDGFWRTAQDMGLKHFDLLKTQQNGVIGTPDTVAVGNYQIFAKKYLKTNYVPEQIAIPANTIYAEVDLGLNLPANINIVRDKDPGTATVIDYRYLHSRGLYVDSVDAKLQQLIQSKFDTCTKTNKEECILPLLAFTSINLTEIANYKPTNASQVLDNSNLEVTSNGFVIYNPTSPARGRTNVTNSAIDGPAFILPTMLQSNSGVAVSLAGIDPEDDVADADTDNDQQFTVGSGGTTSSGTKYKVTVDDGAATAPAGKQPAVAWQTGSGGSDCTGTAYPLLCSPDVDLTNTPSLTTIISNYNYALNDIASLQAYSNTISNPINCIKSNGNSTDTLIVNIAAGTVKARPICKMFSASISPNQAKTVSGSFATESTEFYGPVSVDQLLTITLSDSLAPDIPASDVQNQGYKCIYTGNSATINDIDWDSDPCTQTVFDP